MLQASRMGGRPIRSDRAPESGSTRKLHAPTQSVTIRLPLAARWRTMLPKVGVVGRHHVEAHRGHDGHHGSQQHHTPIPEKRADNLGRAGVLPAGEEFLGLLERVAQEQQDGDYRATHQQRHAPPQAAIWPGDKFRASTMPSSAASITATCWLADCQLT